MENKLNQVALVKSPNKDTHKRKGHGFSLKEIEEAGISIDIFKKSRIKIDYFRKSANPDNIKILKSLEIPSLGKKKRKPFVRKEKKRTPYKPKEAKKKVKPKPTPTKPVPEPVKKEKVKSTKKEKVKSPKVEKIEKVPIQATGKLLTDLSGLGATTAKKFIELGVDCIEALCKEKPEELAPLVKGVSVERLKKWIDEGKELV